MAASNPSCGRIGSTPARSDLRPRVPHEPPYGQSEYLDLRYDGADLRAALVRCLREFRPTTVALPDPLDRHHAGLGRAAATLNNRPTTARPARAAATA